MGLQVHDFEIASIGLASGINQYSPWLQPPDRHMKHLQIKSLTFNLQIPSNFNSGCFRTEGERFFAPTKPPPVLSPGRTTIRPPFYRSPLPSTPCISYKNSLYFDSWISSINRMTNFLKGCSGPASIQSHLYHSQALATLLFGYGRQCAAH